MENSQDEKYLRIRQREINTRRYRSFSNQDHSQEMPPKETNQYSSTSWIWTRHSSVLVILTPLPPWAYLEEDVLTNRKITVKIQGIICDPHDLSTGCPQGSTISPTIFNGLVAQLLTVTLPTSVDILAYADELSDGNSQEDKLQKALNAVNKAANSLGLYFSPAKIKTMAFNTTRQPKFKLGLQHLEMVND